MAHPVYFNQDSHELNYENIRICAVMLLQTDKIFEYLSLISLFTLMWFSEIYILSQPLYSLILYCITPST